MCIYQTLGISGCARYNSLYGLKINSVQFLLQIHSKSKHNKDPQGWARCKLISTGELCIPVGFATQFFIKIFFLRNPDTILRSPQVPLLGGGGDL
jgi:hypothetical protein